MVEGSSLPKSQLVSFLILIQGYVLLILEGKGGGERETVTGCLLYTPLLGGQSHNLGVCPDGDRTCKLSGAWDGAPTESPGQGPNSSF